MKKITEILIKENVNGCKIQLIKGDEPITSSIMETGQWEGKTTKFIKDNLRSGQTFVDIGASIGYYTLLAANLVGSGGKVYSFEPLEENWTILSRNLANNKIKNVVVFFTALSNKPEFKIKLFGGDIPSQYSIVNVKDQKFQEVSNNIFDRLNKEENIVPDMIKIDVGNAQLEVLEGMKKVFETNKELTIILEDYKGDAIKWLIDNYGFKVITTEREAGNYILSNSIEGNSLPVKH